MLASRSLVVLALVFAFTPAAAQDQLLFRPPEVLTDELLPGAPTPGESAFKAKLKMLAGTPGAVHDRRLVSVYGDANSTAQIWDPKNAIARGARDIFARYSDDLGLT